MFGNAIIRFSFKKEKEKEINFNLDASLHEILLKWSPLMGRDYDGPAKLHR